MPPPPPVDPLDWGTAASQVAQILSHYQLRETLATKEKERDGPQEHGDLERLRKPGRRGLESSPQPPRQAPPFEVSRPKRGRLPVRQLHHSAAIFRFDSKRVKTREETRRGGRRDQPLEIRKEV